MPGRRISRTAGGLTTQYCYDGDQIIAEYQNGLPTREFIYGPGIDEPVAMIDCTGAQEVWYYYHYDGSGNVVALSNSNQVVEAYRYDHFGSPTVMTGPGTDGNWATYADNPTASPVASQLGNPYMFTGRQYDDETGLYYYRARMYSPPLGRFLQTDPIGYLDSMNLYQYCGNNPVHFRDPLGTTDGQWAEALVGLNKDYPASQAWADFAEGYSRACQGTCNAFTGGLFDPKAGIFYDTFNNQWVALGEASNAQSDAFAGGTTGARASESLLLAAGSVYAWGALGGPTMDVAIGGGEPFHMAYGTNGVWQHAVGWDIGDMWLANDAADSFAANSWNLTGIPVWDSTAVLGAEGTPAFSCFTATGYSYLDSGGLGIGLGIGGVSSLPLWGPSLYDLSTDAQKKQ